MLIVDDDASILIVLQELLGDVGFELVTANCLAEGLERWGEGEYDLVIVDKNLGDGSGLTIVERVIEDTKQTGLTEVIIVSAFASLESAVEGIRMRIADYLVKPFDDIDVVIDRIGRVVVHQSLKRQNRALVNELQEKNEMLEEMVVRDGLTGLFNHAYFQERLENELCRSERHQHECGLVFIDIDRFKRINDELGHQIGDDVLSGIAELLQGKSRAADDVFRLREHDIAARYGGDEFVLILPETPKTGVAIKAERLRHYVEQMTFPGVEAPVTLSIGVAAYPRDGKDRPFLVRAADTALYAAKRFGRNRVMSYTPDLDLP
ncbi:MAG: diguanylate cyclase, partial [Myxococcota bacterium]